MKIPLCLARFLPLPPMLGGAVEKSWFALAKVTITYAPSQKSPAVRQISQINNSRRRPSDCWESIAETGLAWHEDYVMARFTSTHGGVQQSPIYNESELRLIERR